MSSQRSASSSSSTSSERTLGRRATEEEEEEDSRSKSTHSSSSRRRSPRLSVGGSSSGDGGVDKKEDEEDEEEAEEDDDAVVGRNPKQKRSAATPVLSARYLERSSNKADLVRRLRSILEEFEADECIEPDSADYPGLGSLCSSLVEDRLLLHRDKEVRLLTVLACMEVFCVYAPAPPWKEQEILAIFQQLIRQLGNLAHCTSPSQPHFSNYFHLLELLANVKIGVVLVELVATLKSKKEIEDQRDEAKEDEAEEEEEDDGELILKTKSPRSRRASQSSRSRGGEDGEEVTSEEALEVLTGLIHTILHSVHVDHPADVANHAVTAVAVCVEEFDGTVPIPVLDEILNCIGAGPVVFVTNPVAVEAAAVRARALLKATKMGDDAKKKELQNQKLPPSQIQQTNQSYNVAAGVVRRTEDRISTPIANLLNGLLNGDSHVVSQTSISTSDVVYMASAGGSGGGQGTAHSPTATPTGGGGAADVWTIVYELHRISPHILTTVIGTVATFLLSPNLQKRLRVTKLLGRLFYSPASSIASRFRPCFRDWLRRHMDVELKVRIALVRSLLKFVENKSSAFLSSTSGTSSPEDDAKSLCAEAIDVLIRMVCDDPLLEVRLAAIEGTCELAHYGVRNKGELVAGAALSTSVVLPARLLRAVGNRVSSKSKTERRDAVTGLSQIYYRRYVREKLGPVQLGGDDCDLEVIVDVLQKTAIGGGVDEEDNINWTPSKKRRGGGGGGRRKLMEGKDDDKEDPDLHDLNEKYRWIPRLVLEAACFTDAVDPEMRNRVVQVVDDVLLGTNPRGGGKEEASGSSSSSSSSHSVPLTATSRAVGLAMIVDSITHEQGGDGKSKESTNAYKWMRTLLGQRAKLQRAVGAYIDARSQWKNTEQGSEEELAADTKALEQLEVVASLSAPLTPDKNATTAVQPSELSAVLSTIHKAKDKHIFRILATIASPIHSPSARVRAFDELPKRTQSLGTSASRWIKMLARRCAMGNFLNVEILSHCILLAQECFRARRTSCTMLFLRAVKVGVSVFPKLAGTKEGFGTLVETFKECRERPSDDQQPGVVNILTSILSMAAPARSWVDKPVPLGDASHGPSQTTSKGKKGSPKSKGKKGSPTGDVDSSLIDHLVRLCTDDGSVEEARNAVLTLQALSSSSATEKERQEPEEQAAIFDPLMKALTSPLQLSPSIEGGLERLQSVLKALSTVAEVAPWIFAASDTYMSRGRRAIRFALNDVLLGRRSRNSFGDDDEEGGDGSSVDGGTVTSPSRGQSLSDSARKRARRKAAEMLGLGRSGSEDAVSTGCTIACGAMELLVSHIHATSMWDKFGRDAGSQKGTASPPGKENRTSAKGAKEKGKEKEASMNHPIVLPTKDHVEKVFKTLALILEDGGRLPSEQDRTSCTSHLDRSTLRRHAAVSLLRLCDSRLQLDSRHLPNRMWHVLGRVFLDEDQTVRDAVMEELTMMLLGQGTFSGSAVYGSGAALPALRLMSLVTFCADADHAGGKHLVANGNAPNVGKRSTLTKLATQQCVSFLRQRCDDTLVRCRTLGRDAEKVFDSFWKPRLMPEYVVPFALHLLSFRRETPSAGGLQVFSNEKLNTNEEETNQSMKDDGDDDDDEPEADDEAKNKMLSKRLRWLFEPLVHSLGDGANNISFLLRMVELIGKNYYPVDVSGDGEGSADSRRVQEAAAKIKVICASAREVLLKFIKKDVNLTPYPGSIQIPTALFCRTLASEVPDAAKKTSQETEKGKQPTPIASQSTVRSSIDTEVPRGRRSAGRTSVSFSDSVDDAASIDDAASSQGSDHLEIPRTGDSSRHQQSTQTGDNESHVSVANQTNDTFGDDDASDFDSTSVVDFNTREWERNKDLAKDLTGEKPAPDDLAMTQSQVRDDDEEEMEENSPERDAESPVPRRVAPEIRVSTSEDAKDRRPTKTANTSGKKRKLEEPADSPESESDNGTAAEDASVAPAATRRRAPTKRQPTGDGSKKRRKTEPKRKNAAGAVVVRMNKPDPSSFATDSSATRQAPQSRSARTREKGRRGRKLSVAEKEPEPFDFPDDDLEATATSRKPVASKTSRIVGRNKRKEHAKIPESTSTTNKRRRIVQAVSQSSNSQRASISSDSTTMSTRSLRSHSRVPSEPI